MLCKQCDALIINDKFKCHWGIKDTDKWGPYCSESCMCYIKICSKCGKDFSITHKTSGSRVGIKLIHGEWVCDSCNLS